MREDPRGFSAPDRISPTRNLFLTKTAGAESFSFEKTLDRVTLPEHCKDSYGTRELFSIMTDKELKKLKDDLWHAADVLRSGAHLAANKYGQPILGTERQVRSSE